MRQRPDTRDARLFAKRQALLSKRIAGCSPAFHRYEAKYLRAVSSFQREADFDEVVDAARTASLVHVGDYHTLARSQRWFLKLARRLLDAGRPLVLAVELIEARHQRALDHWLAGRRPEQAFDVWPRHRPVLEFARRRRLRVVALEPTGGGTLRERDRFWARRLRGALNDEATVLTLVGQQHCAHLPALLKSVKQVVVYQNAEPIWFELERRGRERAVEAVKVNDRDWCLLHTSPAAALQSFLNWIDADELSHTDRG